MIVPDVNVLVYAFRRETENHEGYAAWLNDLVAGPDDLGLVDLALLGFLRVVTNPRVYAPPDPNTAALAFVDSLRSARRARFLHGNAATWARFRGILETDRVVRANLVPDAWLAANTLAHGARLATADRGFARFPGLDWFDPAAST